MLRTFFQYWRNSRNIRWGVTVGAALTVAMSLVLMFLLAQATNDPEAYERNFQTLLVANLVVGCMLAAVVGWMGWRVWKRFRRRKFGSRLLLKLVAVFTLVASVPGALTYLVSYQFVTRSIESWFDVRVEHALDAGLSLGRNVLDALTADTASRTQAAATQLGVAQPFGLALTLEQLRVQQNADQLILWDQNGQRIASAGIQSSTHALPAPTADVRAALRTKPVYTSLEGLDDAGDASTSFAPDSPAASTTPAATPRTIDKAPAARIVAYSLVRPGQFGLLDQAWVLEVVKTVPRAAAQCPCGAGHQPGIPGTCPGAHQHAAHVHRHPHPHAHPGRLWGCAAGGAAGIPAHSPSVHAGRRRAAGGRRQSGPQTHLPGA